jgi:hypothetical protein
MKERDHFEVMSVFGGGIRVVVSDVIVNCMRPVTCLIYTAMNFRIPWKINFLTGSATVSF